MGQYLDKTGLSIFWNKVKAHDTSTLTAAKNDATSKDTALKNELNEAIAANASAISTLKGRVDVILADADSYYDTFKEISDYIASDKSGAASMLSSISTLEGYFTNGVAKKAAADGSGNNIASTYLTKTSASSTYLTKTDATSTYATKTNLTSLENSINQTLQTDYATKSELDNLTAGDVDAVSNDAFSEYKSTVSNTYATKSSLNDYIKKDAIATTDQSLEDADTTKIPNCELVNRYVTGQLSYFLTKTDASNTYLTKSVASSTYALKTDLATSITESEINEICV